MNKQKRLISTFLLFVILTLCACSATHPAAPTPAGWAWSNRMLRFTKMAILPDDEVWTITDRDFVMHDYLQVRNPIDDIHDMLPFGILGIAFITPDDGWVVGNTIVQTGQIYHWDGTQWTSKIPSGWLQDVFLEDVKFLDSNHGWAVGESDSHGKTDNIDTPVILRWNGENWNYVSLPAAINTSDIQLREIDVLSAADIWVVGKDETARLGYMGKGIVWHWDGVNWLDIPVPDTMLLPHSISATSSNDAWVSATGSGDEEIFHWDGQNWSLRILPISFDVCCTNTTSAIFANARDDVWAGGRTLFHWDGTNWKDMHYNGEYGNIVDIKKAPGGTLWALTEMGQIMQLFK